MASILILISALSVCLVHAVIRAAIERRALEREAAALDVLARVGQVRIDLGDDRLRHEHVRDERSQHVDDPDLFHVRVLGTRDRSDPAATPRPVPVDAVPAVTRRRPPPLRVVTEAPRPITADGSSASVVRIGWGDEIGRSDMDGRSGMDERSDVDRPPVRLGSVEVDQVEDPRPVPARFSPAKVPAGTPAAHSPRQRARRHPAALVAAAACLVVVAVAAATLRDTGTDIPDRTSNAAATRDTAVAPTTTTTTLPPPPPPVLVRGDNEGAEYRVGPGFGLAVRASDTLYVRVNGADGATLYEEMLDPGQEQMFLSNGPLRIRVGNASVAHIVLNGDKPIALPPTFSPYNLDLSTGSA